MRKHYSKLSLFFQKVSQGFTWLRLLVSPPPKKLVFAAYNELRQHYILAECCRHFGLNIQDPAPLYGKKLLDVGCGKSAELSSFLALAGADVTAVDMDVKALDKAQIAADEYGAPVRFVKGKMEDLVQEGATFDIILTLDVIEYIEDMEKFLWAQEKLLASGGVAVFSAIRKTMRAWLVHVLLSAHILNRTPAGSRVWHGFYRVEVLRGMYLKQGMNIDVVQGLRFDLGEKRWRLAQVPDTRYLGTAARI